jgi:L-2-hydroxyglutarate oxidase LhgO
MVDRVGCVVVGAGVVGLAVARALALAGEEVLVLEAAGAIGTATSSRNSEVIHAGLYYAPGSLRAVLCVAGRRLLYEYCRMHGVPARACGKLIVATGDDELAELDTIMARGTANGVEGLRRLTGAEALALEPELRCVGALLSAETGILDSHGFMLALRGEAEDHGAMFAFHAPLDRAEAEPGGFRLWVGGASPTRLQCRILVNAAGLGACALARRIDGLAPHHVPPAFLAKGSYFYLAGRSPFRRLIYPVPIPGGAGIHLTLDMAGAARFGPDVEPVEQIDYQVDPRGAARFAAAVRRYWPGLPDGALYPAYAGIRPKIVPPTQTQDFVIQGRAVHGVAGLVNLFGIESPGLTASLAIADAVLHRSAAAS